MNFQHLTQHIDAIQQQYSSSSETQEQQQALVWQAVVPELLQKFSQNFDVHLLAYQRIFKQNTTPLVWLPDSEQRTNLGSVLQQKELKSYTELYQWSITQKDDFWKTMVHRLLPNFPTSYHTALDTSSGVENPKWFAGALFNIVEHILAMSSDKTAVLSGNEQGEIKHTSYAQLATLIRQVSDGLVHRGFLAGDRIVLYLPLSLEAVAMYLGIVHAGMVAVLVADSFSPVQLQQRIQLSNAKAVVCYDTYLYGNKWLPMYEKVKQANAPQCILIKGTKDKPAMRQNDIVFDDLLYSANGGSPQLQPDSLISILFSSGTTNEPKAIPWTQLTALKCAIDGHLHQDIQPSDVVSWTTSMGWMMGPWLIYASLLNNATLAVFSGSGASVQFAQFAEKTKLTILGTIPSLVKVWRAQKTLESIENQIRLFSSTGEPSNAEDYLYLMSLAQYKAPIIEYCGGTEIGGGYLAGTVLQPASPSVFTSPTMGSQLYFQNPETEVLKTNQAGQVFLVPPALGLSQQLLNKDHHQEYYANCPKGPHGETLRKHGDAYEMFTIEWNKETYYYYKSQGRTDDAMNLGGIKVSAVEIETLANEHPNVFETAAISVQQKDGPEQLVLYVVPRKSDVLADELKKEIQKMLSTSLNPLFRVYDVVYRANLPRTASNKLMRRELRTEYLSRV